MSSPWTCNGLGVHIQEAGHDGRVNLCRTELELELELCRAAAGQVTHTHCSHEYTNMYMGTWFLKILALVLQLCKHRTRTPELGPSGCG